MRAAIQNDQYAHHDWFAPVIDALNNESPERVAAVRALIDPGHDAEALRVASPLPSPMFGVNVFSTPSVCTYDVDVDDAGLFVYTCPEPSVAFITYRPGDAFANAYYASHAMAVDNYVPARFMQKRGYMGVRCTAKSLTIENTTPVLDRGGYSLCRRINPRYLTYNNVWTNGSLDITQTYNMRRMAEVPLTAAEFEAGSSYQRFDHNGSYMVASMMGEDFSIPRTLDVDIPLALATTTDPLATTLASAMSMTGSSTSPLETAVAAGKNIPVWVVTGQTAATLSFKAFATGMNDGMTLVATMIKAPVGKTQRYSVKFQARYEFIVDPSSPDFPKSVPTEPAVDSFNKLIMLAAEMPGLYPASYNAGGKVWNAFKKGISWLGKNILKPTIGAALNGFKGAVANVVS